MQKRMNVIAVGLLLISMAAPGGAAALADEPAAPATEPVDASGEAALAEHFAQVAQLTLATRTITPAVWQQAVALLRAATRLDPTEPRFWRLLAEASLQSHDSDGALAALQSFAALVPDDQGAQVQIIDLYAAKMQSADQRLAYLRGLVEKPGLSEAVRSYAATRATRILYDRSQDTDAEVMLAQALRLNPVNAEALRMNYDRVAESGTTYERAGALLAMLRGNPAQPDVAARLAGELAAAALPSESITWYNYSVGLTQRLGRAPDAPVLADMASEMIITDQFRQADQVVNILQNFDPNNIDGWYLRLLLAKRSGDTDGFTKSLESATTALLESLYNAHRALTGSDPPSTQPSGEFAGRLPNISDDVKKLKASGKRELIDRYAIALTDLAWLQLYFAGQPANAKPLIDGLRALVAADNITATRLEGWSFLLQNKPDEAKVKLSAVAERDPLAMMGVVQLDSRTADPSQKDQAQLRARTLVNQNASGLLGAILQDGLRDLGGKLIASKDADVIRQRLEAFPLSWLSIMDRPQSFYAVRAEALRSQNGFDEPILGQITVQNNSEFDLSIGPDGVLRPDLWIDVNLRGAVNQNVPGAGYERLSKALVLHKGQAITQQVRLDPGRLGAMLLANPIPTFQMYFFVVTNPTSAANGGVMPGMAGFRQSFRRVVDRLGTVIANPQQEQKIYELLAHGSSEDKIRMISLLGSYYRILTGDQANKGMLAKGKDFQAEMRTMMQDASVPVRSWARYVSSVFLPQEQRGAAVKQLLADTYWPLRAIALISLPEDVMPSAQAKQLAESLKKDPDPVVRELAVSVLDQLEHPTTQPTTAPTTLPAFPPTTQP